MIVGSGTLAADGPEGRVARAVAGAAADWPAGSEGTPHVALVGAHHPDVPAAMCGLAATGWAVGVLDPGWPAPERDGALTQLAPSVWMAPAGHAHLAPWDRPLPAPDGWVARAAPGAWEGRGAPAPTPDTTFYVGFTSGSAGRPKAFARSHASWWHSFARFGPATGVAADGPVLIPGPLSSSHFLFGALHALHVGAPVELAQGLGRLDDAHPPAAVYVVPTMLAQLPPGRAPGPGPRAVYCAGAALERAVVDRTRSRYPDTALVEYYGASELSFVAIRREGDGTPPGSVGRAFPGVRIDIRDEAGRTVPPGGVGTVWVHSDLVFQGYRGQAPASVARRDDEGWLTVGDLGSLDRDGFLRVAGRGTALIITGGANVQPEEVERVLCGAPGVSEAAVVGLPDPRWGQRVCALLVPRAGATLTRADVRAHVAAHLTQGKRPRHYAVASALPLGRTGKVDREEVVRILAATPPEAELR